ncbi:hypothetical protein YC2023_114802 [Brassica napus]
MMMFCINLEVIPEGLNLMSIETVNMVGCLRLRTFTQSFMPFNLRHIFLTSCEKLQSLPDTLYKSSSSNINSNSRHNKTYSKKKREKLRRMKKTYLVLFSN